MMMRRLNARWIAAGRRRIVARGLRADGWTFKRIAAELGVSAEQARQDVRGRHRTIVRYGDDPQATWKRGVSEAAKRAKR